MVSEHTFPLMHFSFCVHILQEIISGHGDMIRVAVCVYVFICVLVCVHEYVCVVCANVCV